MSNSEVRPTIDVDAALRDSSKASLLENEDIQDRIAERALRKSFATWWIWVVVGQLLIMNALFAAVGVGCISYSDWLFHAYLVGTLGEAFAIVLVITRYLFPKRTR